MRDWTRVQDKTRQGEGQDKGMARDETSQGEKLTRQGVGETRDGEGDGKRDETRGQTRRGMNKTRNGRDKVQGSARDEGTWDEIGWDEARRRTRRDNGPDQTRSGRGREEGRCKKDDATKRRCEKRRTRKQDDAQRGTMGRDWMAG